MSKTVTISFLGNVFNDTRVTNLVESLSGEGYSVKVISFDWTSEKFEDVLGNISVYKLSKSGSSLKYYYNFLKILLIKLKASKSDIYIASDVYTLPAVCIIGKLRKKKIYYDCRELYPFLAGLRKKRKTQLAIRIIEKIFIQWADMVITTGPMDAQFIQHYYKITNPIVLRNLPKLREVTSRVDYHELLGIPEGNKILLYQGVLFEGRGIEKTIQAIVKIPNVHFVLLGAGVKKSDFENLADKLGVGSRVHFLGNKSQSELINYTAGADIGLALIENISLSYYYALPNKMFEYIVAGIPVICSMLPQMKDIVDEYNVGWVIDIENGDLAESLKNILNSEYSSSEWKVTLKDASKELNWDHEFANVKKLLF